MPPLFKEFKVVELEGKLGTLQCPRKGCGGEFTVNRALFKQSKPTFPTRPCPYCFQVSLLPGTHKED